ncbi:MAG: xanthine dehydrogenase, partial [Modestobacter sp.]|nr:xanthine dehydrogenase [Modestobacter sp.]
MTAAGTSAGDDASCGVAHGSTPAGDAPERVLVAVFASPVAGALLRFGAELGWRPVLVVEVDDLDTEPPQAGLGAGPDVLRPAVDPAAAHALQQRELGGQLHLLAPAG